jgi:hypothetical protein
MGLKNPRFGQYRNLLSQLVFDKGDGHILCTAAQDPVMADADKPLGRICIENLRINSIASRVIAAFSGSSKYQLRKSIDDLFIVLFAAWVVQRESCRIESRQ